MIEGDSFHRYDRVEMRERVHGRPTAARARRSATSGPRRTCSTNSTRRSRTTARPAAARCAATCTMPTKPSPQAASRAPSRPGRTSTPGTDLLFYEGLHGGVMSRHGRRRAPRGSAGRRGADHQSRVDPEAAPRQAHRAATRHEAVVDTILRRMPDYVNYICPQFSRTARQLPARADGRHVAIRSSRATSPGRREHAGDPLRAIPKGIDFPYLLSMLHDCFMSRAEHDRLPGRQDGAGHAADLHADDPGS